MHNVGLDSRRIVRVLVERRASSVESRAKELQTSAMLPLSGTVNVLYTLKAAGPIVCRSAADYFGILCAEPTG